MMRHWPFDFVPGTARHYCAQVANGALDSAEEDISASFLKKRSKKLLFPPHPSTIPAHAAIVKPAQKAKVFWFCSPEKNILPL